MDRSKLKGIFPPVFTPFNNDGSLNTSVIPAYAEYVKKAGVHGVYVTGTAGEGMSLSLEERKRVAEVWIKEGESRGLVVIVQVGAGCLKDTQQLAKFCEEKGASAIATFPNLFDKAENVPDLVDYCLEVSKFAPSTPLLYYHIPFKTGVTVAMDEFISEGIKKVPTLVGMKYTDQDVSGEGRRCIIPDKTHIFSGFDQMCAEAHRYGYCGSISCIFNILPEAGLVIHKCQGQGPEADEAQTKINNTLDLIFKQTGGFSVSAIKAAMTLLTGVDVGPARKPLKNLTMNQLGLLKEDLTAAGLTIKQE